MRRVILVGSYPPPAGGVSEHVKRLGELLADEFDVQVIDLYGRDAEAKGRVAVRRFGGRPVRGLARLIWELAGARHVIVHFHVSSMERFAWIGYVFSVALHRTATAVITIHSGSFIQKFRVSNWLNRRLIRSLLRRFDRVVCVSGAQLSLLSTMGVSPERTVLLPAFLPPVQRWTKRVEDVLTDASRSGKKLLVMSGYGLPLYGYHILAAALRLDPALGRHFWVALCLYNQYDEQYVLSVEHALSNVVSTCLFRDLEASEFTYLLAHSDVYLRATDRDGDSVAVREAAAFGVPVIASDCVERPEGVDLFNHESPESLLVALSSFIARERGRGAVEAGDSGSVQAFLELFRILGTTVRG